MSKQLDIEQSAGSGGEGFLAECSNTGPPPSSLASRKLLRCGLRAVRLQKIATSKIAASPVAATCHDRCIFREGRSGAECRSDH